MEVIAKIDLGADLREFLQTSLFRKYLNYSSASLEEFSSSTIALGVLKETPELVDNGPEGRRRPKDREAADSPAIQRRWRGCFCRGYD